jgi:hypothetical protein
MSRSLKVWQAKRLVEERLQRCIEPKLYEATIVTSRPPEIIPVAGGVLWTDGKGDAAILVAFQILQAIVKAGTAKFGTAVVSGTACVLAVKSQGPELVNRNILGNSQPVRFFWPEKGGPDDLGCLSSIPGRHQLSDKHSFSAGYRLVEPCVALIQRNAYGSLLLQIKSHISCTRMCLSSRARRTADNLYPTGHQFSYCCSSKEDGSLAVIGLASTWHFQFWVRSKNIRRLSRSTTCMKY